MKQKLKINWLVVCVLVLFCVLTSQQSAAQEPRVQQNTEMRNQQRKQLGQMDQDIERLRQIMKEAEEIRARIARDSQLNDAFRPQPQPQPQRENLRQLPPSTGTVQPGIMEPRPDIPALSRPGVQRIIDNIPQMIDQLRDAFNNNVERVHNAYQKLQEKLINLQSDNERLRNENQQLRDENQRLRNRLQEIAPRRSSVGQAEKQ
jgi:cell shape-determining protein MreC